MDLHAMVPCRARPRTGATWPRRFGLCFIAAAAVGLIGAAPATQPHLRIENLDIVSSRGIAHFKVEVADSFGSRERGLMFRRHLGARQGMLFEFEKPQPQWFWMKNTLIPLDILFIDSTGRIVSIARDATPMSETPIGSGEDALAVLEIPGGRAAQVGVQIGDHVRSRFFRQ